MKALSPWFHTVRLLRGIQQVWREQHKSPYGNAQGLFGSRGSHSSTTSVDGKEDKQEPAGA